MKFKCFYLFLVLAFLWASCKKDNSESTPPEITILEPTENSIFNVFDTVQVKFDVSDNDRLSNVTVSLLDASNVQAMPGIIVTPNTASATITMNYILSDIHLPSGYYYIKVYANDGSTGTYRLRQIYINEAPRQLEGAYLLSMPNAFTRALYKIDSLQVIQSCGSFTGDFLEMEISSWYKDLYLGGHYNGSTLAIETDDNSQLWSIPAVISSNPYFTDIHVSGKNVYVSYYDGRIKGYSYNGATNFNAASAPNWTVRKISRHDIYMIADTKDQTSAQRKLVVFNGTTGAGVQEAFLNQDVLEFYSKDNSDLFCFGNEAGQGKMEIYQLSSNGFWTPYSVPAGLINSVAQVDAGTYLIAHSNGNIYKYTYSNNSFLVHVPGVTASKVCFDPVNLLIYTIEGTQVKRYNYQTGVLVNSITHSAGIMDLELLFNK